MNANDRAKIEALRDKWSDWAFLLQDLYGQDDPTCIAIRKCIADIYDLIAEPEGKDFVLKQPPAKDSPK